MELNFKVDEALCIKCKNCVMDCPVGIIDFDTLPFIKNTSHCLKCQHCLAVCPTGALSILNRLPVNSIVVEKEGFNSEEFEKLIKLRRTVRRFKSNDLPIEIIEKLVEVASYSPSGHNSRKTLLTITGTKVETEKFIDFVMNKFGNYLENNELDEEYGFLKYVYYQYRKKRVDITFRGAPHIIVTSIPKGKTISYIDTIIFLSYFEIYANSLNIGTLWSGIGKYFFEILPDLKEYLGIPLENEIGYVMGFGYPDVKYYRAVQHEKLQYNILGQ